MRRIKVSGWPPEAVAAAEALRRSSTYCDDHICVVSMGFSALMVMEGRHGAHRVRRGWVGPVTKRLAPRRPGGPGWRRYR